MKTLILTCNTGEGHNSAAAAVRDVFEKNNEICDRADTLAFLSRFASYWICKWHVTIYRHCPRVFSSGYRAAENHPRAFQSKSKIYKLLTMGTEKLYRNLVAGGYDTVICPHVFSAVLVTALREKHPELALRAYFIATDYTCSPIVRECNMDGFIIPDASLTEEFVMRGVPEDKLLCMGLPVRQAFLTRTDRTEARAACGLPEQGRHILMMCGSMGCGPMEEMTARLSVKMTDDTVLSVVCGTNERLRNKLTRQFAERENIRILGYVNNVPTLMDSADLYLTKPGGLSVTEGAAKRLPMVFVDAVAGCEAYNLRWFTERGMARTADTPEELADLCVSLLADEAQLADMRERLAQNFRTDAAQAIYDMLVRTEEKGEEQPA